MQAWICAFCSRCGLLKDLINSQEIKPAAACIPAFMPAEQCPAVSGILHAIYIYYLFIYLLINLFTHVFVYLFIIHYSKHNIY